MNRVLVAPERVRGSTIVLEDPRELHHLRHVLRRGRGDEVRCFDGQGREYLGRIEEQTARRVVIRVLASLPAAPPRDACWLLLSLLKADRFDWVVQKATELGVSQLSPLVTRRTVARAAADQAAGRLSRWRRIAQEAAKQCGRATVPSIDPPRRLDEVLPVLRSAGLVLMPTLAVPAVPLAEALRARAVSGPVAVLIGPEGDFEREEVALAQACGALPVSLGELTLRSETAAVATLAILRYAAGIL